MAQPASHPKIEELRFRLKTDPKSRLFYPLAEELRKAGQVTEAESVLRGGLGSHPTYLSAWVSLGRVLRDQKKEAEAVDALNTALQLDPGNVVAARLLADAYLALGEKVEAIKKYKLVHALLPSDQELAALIHTMERELGPPPPVFQEPAPEPPPAAIPEPQSYVTPDEPEDAFDDASGRVFDETGGHILLHDRQVEEETRDLEPMSVAHEESPFEEPATEAYTAASLAIEAPLGMHVEPAPLTAEVPTPVQELLPEADAAEPFGGPFAADPFAVEPPPAAAAPETVTNTLTMADIYERQGLVAEASHIYENILARDPGNEAVRAKFNALTGGDPRVRKIRRLEEWLAKVSRREVGSV
ncbi:MAG TPA: tetratricopeptide repeat protein [Thermoanaerobaculia bacterium]